MRQEHRQWASSSQAWQVPQWSQNKQVGTHFEEHVKERDSRCEGRRSGEVQRGDPGRVSNIHKTVETVAIGEYRSSKELQFSISGRKIQREHSEKK